MITSKTIDHSIRKVADKIYANERITEDEALVLLRKASLGQLGSFANFVRERKNQNHTYFNKNIHIEPTNLCVFSCKFCSYSRLLKNADDGWFLTEDQIIKKVKAYGNTEISEVHIVGGVHPHLTLEYFTGILKKIKTIRPNIHIKGFTAVELDYIFRKAKVSISEGLSILKEAGLDSIPGGGAEIFDNNIRSQICGDKVSTADWIAIHKTAHSQGIPSNATMLYGHLEKDYHRIEHMALLRKLQDETGGFNTFIPLKFRNTDNEMSYLQETSRIDDLKTYAIARIFLDNFAHLKAYWPMIGRSTAQLLLSFGVDDIDGTIDDTTKIYSLAGSEEQNPKLTTNELVNIIWNAGRVAVERDTLYNPIKVYENSDITKLN